MFCLFDGSFLFLIDLSIKTVIKKIDMKNEGYKSYAFEINDLCLLEKNGVQNLYLSVYDKGDKILKGNVL